MWGAWIEILFKNAVMFNFKSLPVWGAWIEMVLINALK